MSLSREAVLTAAIDILDSYGLGDLTMRRLAATLGVQPGALYWHFTNKQTLLGVIADEILTGLPTIDADDWSAATAAWARSLHATLRAHRSGAELVGGVLALRSWDESPARPIEQALRGVGADEATARAAAAGVLHLVLGHTADEEQAAQLTELGVKATPAPEDSGSLLDAAVSLLLTGVAEQVR